MKIYEIKNQDVSKSGQHQRQKVTIIYHSFRHSGVNDEGANDEGRNIHMKKKWFGTIVQPHNGKEK